MQFLLFSQKVWSQHSNFYETAPAFSHVKQSIPICSSIIYDIIVNIFASLYIFSWQKDSFRKFMVYTWSYSRKYWYPRFCVLYQCPLVYDFTLVPEQFCRLERLTVFHYVCPDIILFVTSCWDLQYLLCHDIRTSVIIYLFIYFS